jgi:hypothetical protein
MASNILGRRVRKLERQRGGPPGTRPNAWNRITPEQLQYLLDNDGAWPPGMPGELIDALIEDMPPIYARLSADQLAFIAEHGQAPPGVREEDLR